MPPRALPAAVLAAALALGLPAAADPAWLEVDAPAATDSQVEAALLEVAGHAGARRGRGHDVVIAIDASESTLADAGVDLDEDGAAGSSDPGLVAWLENQLGDDRLVARLRGQDFEDTVLAAELMAAEALIERLDPGRFRVGLVAFADDARELAPLGSPRTELRRALDELRRTFYAGLGGTHYAAAVEHAHAMLRALPGFPYEPRARSIVFLSDGAPTRPVLGDRAERYALEAARAAALDGIRLYAFALGSEAEAGLAVLERMAGWTSGRLETVARPAEIVARLRRIDLVDLAEVDVANETTGAAVRALRVFPDGRFDGFVELAPGRNRIAFEARGRDGSRHRALRWVTRELPAAPAVAEGDGSGPGAPDVAAGPDPLLDALRRRTAEIEAQAELERRRAAQRRELELRVEER